jgi:hypothetical protein
MWHGYRCYPTASVGSPRVTTIAWPAVASQPAAIPATATQLPLIGLPDDSLLMAPSGGGRTWWPTPTVVGPISHSDYQLWEPYGAQGYLADQFMLTAPVGTDMAVGEVWIGVVESDRTVFTQNLTHGFRPVNDEGDAHIRVSGVDYTVNHYFGSTGGYSRADWTADDAHAGSGAFDFMNSSPITVVPATLTNGNAGADAESVGVLAVKKLGTSSYQWRVEVYVQASIHGSSGWASEVATGAASAFTSDSFIICGISNGYRHFSEPTTATSNIPAGSYPLSDLRTHHALESTDSALYDLIWGQGSERLLDGEAIDAAELAPTVIYTPSTPPTPTVDASETTGLLTDIEGWSVTAIVDKVWAKVSEQIESVKGFFWWVRFLEDDPRDAGW